MSEIIFDKYGKIENINKHQIPAGTLVIQHKLDGANAGIELQAGGLLVHSRKTPLALIEMDEAGQIVVRELAGQNAGFAGLVALVKANFVALRDEMTVRGYKHIYGEWLIPHTIKYADGMYRKFYVYDIESDAGLYLNPAEAMPDMRRFGFEPVDDFTFHSVQATHAQIESIAQSMQERLGYGIEGVVVKSYVNQRDQRGNRNCFKWVFPAFHEEKGSDTAAHAPQPAEQAIAAHLPERTIEKRYLDVVSANGGFEGKLIPQIMGRVWSDFVTEFLDAALRDAKYPVVNTRELKRLVDQRAREFTLNYRTEGAA